MSYSEEPIPMRHIPIWKCKVKNFESLILFIIKPYDLETEETIESMYDKNINALLNVMPHSTNVHDHSNTVAQNL